MGAPKILTSMKRVVRNVAADTLAIKRARKIVAPVAAAFVAKLFDKSFGATPPGKPAPERSRTDLIRKHYFLILSSPTYGDEPVI